MKVDIVEVVEGPIYGFFVATYASRQASAFGHVAYGKICRMEPYSYWEAISLAKFSTPSGATTAAKALAQARLIAKVALWQISARVNGRTVERGFAWQPSRDNLVEFASLTKDRRGIWTNK
jgi:hypothetical protein